MGQGNPSAKNHHPTLSQLNPHLLYISRSLEIAEAAVPRARLIGSGHAGHRVRAPGCPSSQSLPVSRPSRLSRTWSCRRKPELGQILRWACTAWMASTSVMFSQIMRKARTTVAERLTPIAQCTSTRPAGRPNLESATCPHKPIPLGIKDASSHPSVHLSQHSGM